MTAKSKAAAKPSAKKTKPKTKAKSKSPAKTKAKAKPAPSKVAKGEVTPTKPKSKRIHDKLKPAWKPGQSGNPKGRPKGSRSKISEAFLAALHEDFERHGVATLKKVRRRDPVAYMGMVAKLVPKDLNVNHTGDAFAQMWSVVAQGGLEPTQRQLSRPEVAPGAPTLN